MKIHDWHLFANLLFLFCFGQAMDVVETIQHQPNLKGLPSKLWLMWKGYRRMSYLVLSQMESITAKKIQAIHQTKQGAHEKFKK